MPRTVLCVILGFALSGPVLGQGAHTEAKPGIGPFIAGLTCTVVPTVAGLALFAGGSGGSRETGFHLAGNGLLLGPAIGDWAGGLIGRGFAGWGLRTLAAVGGLGVAQAICWDSCSNAGEAAAAVVAIGGLAVAAGHAVWDLATLRSAIRQHRARSVVVVPGYLPSRRAAGLTVWITF